MLPEAPHAHAHLLYPIMRNHSYEVRKKKKGCVDEIADLILEKFTRKINPANKRSWRPEVRGAAVAVHRHDVARAVLSACGTERGLWCLQPCGPACNRAGLLCSRALAHRPRLPPLSAVRHRVLPFTCRVRACGRRAGGTADRRDFPQAWRRALGQVSGVFQVSGSSEWGQEIVGAGRARACVRARQRRWCRS